MSFQAFLITIIIDDAPVIIWLFFFKVELTSSYKHALYSVNATHVYISKQYAMTYTNIYKLTLLKLKFF